MTNWTPSRIKPTEVGNYRVAALPSNYQSIQLEQLNKWRREKGIITAWFDGNNFYGFLPDAGTYGRIFVTHYLPMENCPILSQSDLNL